MQGAFESPKQNASNASNISMLFQRNNLKERNLLKISIRNKLDDNDEITRTFWRADNRRGPNRTG